MADYVDTTDDNGGVHTNSGIPNRAFYLAATAIGGDTWEGAGQIWYAALTGGQVTADTDFAGFAAATIAAAGDHADAVRQAWSHRRRRPDRHRQRPVGRHAGRARRRPRTPYRWHRGPHPRGVGRPVRRRPAGGCGPRPRRPARPVGRGRGRDASPMRSATPSRSVGGRSRCPQQQLSDDQRALADLLLRAGRLTVSRRQGAVEGGGHVQRRARDRPGARQSACLISSSSSVQPSSTPPAPASHSSSITPSTRRRVASTTRPCTSSS